MHGNTIGAIPCTLCYCVTTFVQEKSAGPKVKEATKGASAEKLTCKPKTGRKATEGPTPAKSPALAADDVDCVPDTPDEGSASKAVHAALASPAAQQAPTSTAAPPTAAVLHASPFAADAAASVNAVSTTGALEVATEAAPAGAGVTKRIVPESPDLAPLPGASPGEGVSQPQSSTPAPLQEPTPAAAPLVEQHASQSQDLHLSLGLHNSKDNGLDGRHATLSGGQQNALSAAEKAAEEAAEGAALPAVIGACVLAQSQAVNQPDATSVSASNARAAAVVLAPAAAPWPQGFLTDAAATSGPPPASAVALCVTEEAAAAAVTPAGSRQAAIPILELSLQGGDSPMNDSALMAALDSAERKLMQVGRAMLSLLLVASNAAGCCLCTNTTCMSCTASTLPCSHFYHFTTTFCHHKDPSSQAVSYSGRPSSPGTVLPVSLL